MTSSNNGQAAATRAGWASLWRSHDTCHEAVTRRGEEQPCNKPAVAARYDFGEGGGDPYPVCAYHARTPMVPLTALLSAFAATDVTAGVPGCRDVKGRFEDESPSPSPQPSERAADVLCADPACEHWRSVHSLTTSLAPCLYCDCDRFLAASPLPEPEGRADGWHEAHRWRTDAPLTEKLARWRREDPAWWATYDETQRTTRHCPNPGVHEGAQTVSVDEWGVDPLSDAWIEGSPGDGRPGMPPEIQMRCNRCGLVLLDAETLDVAYLSRAYRTHRCVVPAVRSLPEGPEDRQAGQ